MEQFKGASNKEIYKKEEGGTVLRKVFLQASDPAGWPPQKNGLSGHISIDWFQESTGNKYAVSAWFKGEDAGDNASVDPTLHT